MTAPDLAITRIALAIARDGIELAAREINRDDALLRRHTIALDTLTPEEKAGFVRRLTAELGAIRSRLVDLDTGPVEFYFDGPDVETS